jgi:uncharacterized membrane protein YwzB
VRRAARITKRRLLVVGIAVVVALAILSFVLPYVGGGGSGITNLFP